MVAQGDPTDNREAPAVLRLSVAGAHRHIRSALRREFGRAYRSGSFKRIAGCVRISSKRTRCRRLSWSAGDTGFRGSATVWLEHDDYGDVAWSYSLTVRRTYYYCKARKRARDPRYIGKSCTTVHRSS